MTKRDARKGPRCWYRCAPRTETAGSLTRPSAPRLRMHLGAQKTTEREDECTPQSRQRIESQGFQVQVREQPGQEHVHYPQPHHGQRRRQQGQQQHLRQVRQAKLTVGENRIAGEDARQPQRKHASVKLLADPLRQRVVKEPRVQLVEGGSTEEAVAVQDERADGDRGNRGQVDEDCPCAAFSAAGFAVGRRGECAAHAARATASTDNPNGNGTPRGISSASTATSPSSRPLIA